MKYYYHIHSQSRGKDTEYFVLVYDGERDRFPQGHILARFAFYDLKGPYSSRQKAEEAAAKIHEETGALPLLESFIE